MASGTPGSRTPGEASTVDDAVEASFEKRTNAFNELDVRELRTQWSHKVSVVPETSGITTKWWEFSGGVTRAGPSAEVSPGEEIYTAQSGEYNVGDPALAGAGVRFGDADPVDGAGDDWWTGYTNRLIPGVSDADGVGIGVKYFAEGEGDNGGARSAGPQEYIWFRSAVPGVPDRVIPKDQWDNPGVSTDFFRDGGFIRAPFTFYDEGYARLNWNVKTDTGYDIRTLHTFTIAADPMWAKSDLHWQMASKGSNVAGYIDAAHYKAGTTIRENAEGRDGTVAGSAPSFSQGTPIPLISLKLRSGWENVNLTPLSMTVDCDSDYYVFISIGPTLTGATFSAPGSDFANVTPADSEYAAVADNDATGFDGGDTGSVEYTEYVPADGKKDGSSISDEIDQLGLAPNQIATLGIIPIGATTLNGSSFRWGANF